MMSVSRLSLTFERRDLKETRAAVVVVVAVETALLCFRLGEDLSEVIMMLLPLPPPPPRPCWWLSIVVAVRFEEVPTDKLALLFVVPIDGVAESLFSELSERGCMEVKLGGIRNEFESCFLSFSPF